MLATGCGSTQLVSTPVENIDTLPYKNTELTSYEKENWMHLDLTRDTIPGMSVQRAYDELLKGKRGKTVVVAVMDSGIDLGHEDLDDVLWTNSDEDPGNGIDDDNNGYVDDVHGYNFLGESVNEQLEMARIIRLNLGNSELQARATEELAAKQKEANENYQFFSELQKIFDPAHEYLTDQLGKADYTEEDLQAFKPADEQGMQYQLTVMRFLSIAETGAKVQEMLEGVAGDYKDLIDYGTKVSFNGREQVGDDAYDINDRGYGNGDPSTGIEQEDHGTHVAGIIAAERGNSLGIDGVASNVEIMALRILSNGDEYDKDVALGIRYAVDNGARVINCSFGKYFSVNPEWVYDAIKYAASRDVLIVMAAGNESKDLDNVIHRYPKDNIDSGEEFADNVLTVGALAPDYGSSLVAGFTNYGKKTVDIYAPGVQVYSLEPDNGYVYHDGSSMAAPAVSGVAALIRSYYPELSAAEVKDIIMKSGITTKQQVVVPGDGSESRPFAELSVSGNMVNAFNALLMADQRSRSNKRTK